MSSTGTIVIIDDSEVVLDQMRRELEAAGHTVRTSTQTVGAARLLVGADIVILDFHMPGLHGAQVLESFRAAAKGMAKPPGFFMYTSDPEEEARFRQHGFDGVFTNKGNIQALSRQVGAAMRMRRMAR